MAEQNKEIITKINDSFTKGDMEAFLDYCADDVKWTMYGEKHVEGKKAIREWMSEMDGAEPPKFTFDTLIADGDLVAAPGNMTMKDKEGNNTPYSFCDIYRFQNGKITEIRSFVVKTETTETQRSASA